LAGAPRTIALTLAAIGSPKSNGLRSFSESREDSRLSGQNRIFWGLLPDRRLFGNMAKTWIDLGN